MVTNGRYIEVENWLANSFALMAISVKKAMSQSQRETLLPSTS
jgi:hypothetical protein